MAEIEAHPASSPANDTANKADLLIRLDELLEHYLNALHRYQQAQQQMTTHLTSGFLSLAQANFNNQSRTRYGQDYYDERMRALRKINVTVDESAVAFGMSAVESGPSLTSQASEKSPKASEEGPSADLAAVSGTPGVNSAPATDNNANGDPLRWFGILVPAALRSAQSSFVSAVQGPIPELATLIRDLRRQEADIARLRKQIRKL